MGYIVLSCNLLAQIGSESNVLCVPTSFFLEINERNGYTVCWKSMQQGSRRERGLLHFSPTPFEKKNSRNYFTFCELCNILIFKYCGIGRHFLCQNHMYIKVDYKRIEIKIRTIFADELQLDHRFSKIKIVSTNTKICSFISCIWMEEA